MRRFEPEATPALPAARPLQILLVEDSIEAVAGTGIIVTEDAKLAPGDTVAIRVAQIGELSNTAETVA